MPVAVIDGHLHERLADSLDDAAVQLTLDDQRVDDGAEIIDRDVFHHLDHAGLGVELDFADVASVGIS